ncbi:MAG TPA: hypothetical protein VKT30_02025 [Caulobacteraceae bacterium]|nr:hypothetical protein [Caulobacteraceae bacterium]
MRFCLNGVAVVALAASFAALAGQAKAQDFGGRWRTNQGDLRMHQDGGHVEGDYSLNDGQLEGHTEGDRLEGVWWQSTSMRRCPDERRGSYYWGRFRFHLNEEGNAFRGRWSYCDVEPGEGVIGGEWTGERERRRY